MFFSRCSPPSSNSASSRPATSSWTRPVTQTPPGAASASSRAATLTPSPKMSSPSTMTSPTCTPMRNWISRAACPRIARWISTAQRTASTTLENSARKPSPVVLKMRPRCAATAGSISSVCSAFSRASVPSSSAPISRE